MDDNDQTVPETKKKWRSSGPKMSPDPPPTFHTFTGNQESSIPSSTKNPPPHAKPNANHRAHHFFQSESQPHTVTPGSQGIDAYRRGDYMAALAIFNKALNGGDLDHATRLSLTSNRAHAYEKVCSYRQRGLSI